MASITIPTASTVHRMTLGGYIYNEDNASIQALFNNDTNWTAHNGNLYYKNVPVITYYTANNNHFICRCNKHSNGGVLTASGYNIATSNVIIYDFTTFTVFSGERDYTDYKDTSYSATTESACIVVDKTNEQVVEAWLNSSTLMLAGGSRITLDENDSPVFADLAICDAGGGPTHNISDVKRTISLSDVVYYKEYDSEGNELTRFVLLKQFPTGAVFTTLHVGENYYFVLPYPERTYATPGVSTATEIWCALAIDVTSEVS